MADNQTRRWRNGTSGGSVRRTPQAESNRLAGRFFFSLASIAVLGLIVYVLIPPSKSHSWVVTASTGPLDDFSFAVPFADEAYSWVVPPDKSSPRLAKIPELQSVDQIEEELRSWKNARSQAPPSAKDTLIVYLATAGIQDDVTRLPQIVISAPKDLASGPDAESANSADSNPSGSSRDYLISAKSILEMLSEQPFESILVVFDCSRTLDARRWGWSNTNTFPSKIGQVLNDLGKSSPQKASKLWVLCSTDKFQFGLPMAHTHKSQFGWTWHKSLSAAKKKAKISPVTIRNIYENLQLNRRSDQAPQLFHAEHEGPIVSIDIFSRLNSAIWHEDVVPFSPDPEPKSKTGESPDGVEKSPKNKEADELAEVQASVKGKLAGRAFEALGIKAALADYHDAWKLCHDLEAANLVIKSLPSGKQGQLSQPFIYAPHLWRALKTQLVADEYSLLAGVTPPRSAQQYLNLLSKLSTYPTSRPSGLSETVFDRMETAWYTYALSTTRNEVKSSAKPEKEMALIEAHRQYAETLFQLSDFVTLENRLNSVTNAIPFTRAEEVKLLDGAALLQEFYRVAFDTTAKSDSTEIVERLIALGEKLKAWKENAFTIWTDFATDLLLPDSNKNTARNNSVTLDLILTSSLWTREQRQEWRAVQARLSEFVGESKWNPGADPTKPNVESLIALSEAIGADVEPLRTDSSTWPKFYSKLARSAQTTASKNGYEGAKAHLMSSLCAPRDYAAFVGNEPTWLVPQLKPDAIPEQIALESVPVETPPPPAATGTDTPPPKPPVKPQIVELDKKTEDAFKFRVLWIPSPDRPTDKTLSVKLNASFDENWIVAERTRTIQFDEKDRVREDGVREKEISWPVKMPDQQYRRVGDKAESLLQITIDSPSIDSIKQSRTLAAAPSLRIDQSKATLACPIILRNERAVTLSLRLKDRTIGIPRKGSAHRIYEIPMLPDRDFAFDWIVRNDSPIPVKIKAQLWSIEASKDWQSPRGRIPTDDIIGDKGGPLRPIRKPAFAEYEFPQPVDAQKTAEIAWTPPAADAPKTSPTVTAGVYCRITVDDQPNRECWLEFVPWEPRRWLSANATITQTSEIASAFEASLAPRDKGQWPWTDYSNEVISKLTADFERPMPDTDLNWDPVGGNTTSVPGAFRARLTPVNSLNDPLLIAHVGHWPRAFRWSLSVQPSGSRAAAIQNPNDIYRVKFTTVEYFTGAEKLDPATNSIAPTKTLHDLNGLRNNSKQKPWYLPVPSQDNLPQSKITFSWEADTPSGVYADGALNGRSPELRLEQVYSDGEPKKLEGWRADRLCTTTCSRDPEIPTRLVFNSNLRDFRHVPLETQDVLNSSLLTFRGQFYGADTPPQPLAEDENAKPVYLLFDGTRPNIQIVNWTYDTAKGQLDIEVDATDGTAQQPGSGVVEIAAWKRKNAPVDVPFTKAELEMPGDRIREIPAGTRNHHLRVDMAPEELAKPHVIVVQCTDGVGLTAIHDRNYEGLSSLPGGQMARDAAGLPKNGVIEGILIFPNGKKPAGGFKVYLDEDPDSEVTTKADGNFRFTKLDRAKEYHINVNARSVAGTNYGLTMSRKSKAGDPDDSEKKTITITLENLKKGTR